MTKDKNGKHVLSKSDVEFLKEFNIIGYADFTSDKGFNKNYRIAYIVECINTDYEETSYIIYQIGGVTKGHKIRRSRMYDTLDESFVMIDKCRTNTSNIKYFN